MKSIDPLLDRQYDINSYNCVHFLCDAWQYLFDESLHDRMQGFLRAMVDKQFIRDDLKTFRKIPEPLEPCIVVMQARFQSPHVGLFYCGNVLHLPGHCNAKFEPLHMARLGYEKVSFYQ